MTKVIRICQRGWIAGCAGAGWGLKGESGRDISSAEHQRKPSSTPSHPISSTPARRPPCRPYLNNNCLPDAATPPDALPSAHQTSVDWVHLVPCDALSKSLIYKEINGPHNNKGLNGMTWPSDSPQLECLMNNRQTAISERPTQLMSCPPLIGPALHPVVWSFEPRWIKVNSDGKANLDILSPVKYGEELLNEQLIPWRYPAPAEKLENGTKYL